MIRNYNHKIDPVDKDRMLAVKNMKIASAVKKFEMSRNTLQNWLKNINEGKIDVNEVIVLIHGRIVSFVILIY